MNATTTIAAKTNEADEIWEAIGNISEAMKGPMSDPYRAVLNADRKVLRHRLACLKSTDRDSSEDQVEGRAS